MRHMLAVAILCITAGAAHSQVWTNCNTMGQSTSCYSTGSVAVQPQPQPKGFGEGFASGYSQFGNVNTNALQVQNQQQQLRLQQQQLNQQQELIQQQQQMLNMMHAQQATPVEPKAPVEGLPWLEHK